MVTEKQKIERAAIGAFLIQEQARIDEEIDTLREQIRELEKIKDFLRERESELGPPF